MRYFALYGSRLKSVSTLHELKGHAACRTLLAQ